MIKYFLGTILKSKPLYTITFKYRLIKIAHMIQNNHGTPTITFYKDSPYVLTFIVEDTWRLNFNEIGGL